MKKGMAILLFFVVLLLVSGCSNREETTRDYYSPIIDNNVNFTYDSHSTHILSDFENIDVFSSLAMEHGDLVFHQKEDSIYTVFSLNGSGLCYVFIEYMEGSGISWYIKDVIEYPSDSIDQAFYHRIFTMDYPDQIIERQ